MSNVLIVGDDDAQNKIIESALGKNSITTIISQDEDDVFKKLEDEQISLIILDAGMQKFDALILSRKLKSYTHLENILVIAIVQSEKDNLDILKSTNSYITKPVNEKILLATVNSNLKLKKSLDILAQNNSELAKSLYQLDVLYNTSAQFAGSLDKQKLINILIDGLDKSLSFSLSYTLVFNSEEKVDLIINSLNDISPRLLHSLKMRAILSYKALFDKKETPYDIDVDDINVIKNIKHPLEEYDLNILKFDNLFAPIKVGEKFFGLIEVFRDVEFSQEDTTCFQTLARQVSLPLENAALYEEIKNTNTKLEKLERLKSEFTSIVSHELRTPLTAIKNSLDIMLSGKTGETTPAMNKFLDMAKRNVTRLSGIINDLLDLTKVEAGKMDFRFEKASINAPVEFVKNTFENLAKEKNITLLTETEPGLPETYIDTQRLEQVITNLVSNAVKFTNENGRILIKTETVSDEDIDKDKLFEVKNPVFYKQYVKVSVTDSGIGIAQDDIPKVFDKFQQIENSLSRKNGGTGLGLPIAKQLIEAHSGFIWVESELNCGTTFSFVIPVLSEKEKFEQDFAEAVEKSKNSNHNLLLLKIQETDGYSPSMSDDLKENKISIIRKTTNTKEIFYKEDGKKNIMIFIPEADKFAQNFIEKKIESYIQGETSSEKYDIVYSTVLFPDDGNSPEELLKKTDELIK